MQLVLAKKPTIVLFVLKAHGYAGLTTGCWIHPTTLFPSTEPRRKGFSQKCPGRGGRFTSRQVLSIAAVNRPALRFPKALR